MKINDLNRISNGLMGDEWVLMVQAGLAVLVPSSEVALAPFSLTIDAAASPLDQAKILKRKAVTAQATMSISRINKFHVSIFAGMPGALLDPLIGVKFNEDVTGVRTKLNTLIGAIDAAATIEEVDAIVW